MNWIVEKITKNHYKATSDDEHFIEFKLDEIFENYDVIIDNSPLLLYFSDTTSAE